jgi:segregation and condensation protein A
MEDPYKVRLEIFEGPLDLLLYLVKKDEIEINDISIQRITNQYLTYMEAFKMLNIDLASEFIVMAANLMYIKSRTLLPKLEQPPEEDADEGDPRWELIRQLIEYKKFKDAAGFLQTRAYAEANVFPAQPESAAPAPVPAGLPEVGIFDLIRAFQKVLDKVRAADLREIVDDRWTVSDKIDHLLRVVPHGAPVRFSHLFAEATTRDEIIVTFIAVLELMKLRQLRITQDHLLGEIVIYRNENS